MFEEQYKGKKIVIKTEKNVEKLYIGNKLVDTIYDANSKEYHCTLLPYSGYKSLTKLAKDLIDNG